MVCAVGHAGVDAQRQYRAYLLSLGATEAQAATFATPHFVFQPEWCHPERVAYMLRVHAAAGGVLSPHDASALAYGAFPFALHVPPQAELSTECLVHTLLRLREVAQAYGLSLCDLGHHGELVDLLQTPEEDGAVYRLNDALGTLSFLPPLVLREVARSMPILDVASMEVDAIRQGWAESSLSILSPQELLQEARHPRFQQYITNIMC